MVEFTANDVLLKHSDDVLSYAVDSIGNRKFQVYLDIYRQLFLYAEQRKDTVTCNKIVTDIVETICIKSVPNGRFLEFDDKKKVWYDVGTGAIPCQRARTGLLGLRGKTTSNDYHGDKPVVDMSKTKRARTMKVLHFSEKKLRAVVNLNDERFKVKEPVLLDDVASYVPPLVAKIASNERAIKKRVTHMQPSANYSKIDDEERKVAKRSKLSSKQEANVDVTCGGTGEGILYLDSPGNRLFNSLITSRKKNYRLSNDKEKFQEVCNVIKLMKQLCPSCRFVMKKKNSMEITELKWEDIMEKTIQSFCNPCKEEHLSDNEIEQFILSLKDEEKYDSYVSRAFIDAPDNITSLEIHNETIISETTANENNLPDEAIVPPDISNDVAACEDNADDVLPTIVGEDNETQSDKAVMVVDYLLDEGSHVLSNQEQKDYLDVFFPETEGNPNELTAADDFLRSILVL